MFGPSRTRITAALILGLAIVPALAPRGASLFLCLEVGVVHGHVGAVCGVSACCEIVESEPSCCSRSEESEAPTLHDVVDACGCCLDLSRTGDDERRASGSGIDLDSCAPRGEGTLVPAPEAEEDMPRLALAARAPDGRTRSLPLLI